MVVPTLVKVLLALLPRAVMAVMHTTMIRASMTAYSTAVGPSSRCRKFATFCMNLRMVVSLWCQEVRIHSGGAYPKTSAATLLKRSVVPAPRSLRGQAGPLPRSQTPAQLAVEPMVVPTLVKVLLALLPRAVMAVMHTTMIRASMTAYSTAVGPSSRCRKFATFCMNLRMVVSLWCQEVRIHSGGAYPKTSAATLLKRSVVPAPRSLRGQAGPLPRSQTPAQLAVEPMVVPTLVKILLALLPRAVMAVMHTTMIRASMTAY